MKKKIIVVAYHIGRVGSSAMMGLLKAAGFNAGDPAKMTAPAPMNPKGFFELKEQNRFLGEAFKKYYPDIVNPPSIETVLKAAKSHHHDYNRLIKKELGEKTPYIVKAQRFLALSFFHYLRDEYDVKVIVMNRDEQKQVESILRVWRSDHSSPFQKEAPVDFVIDWIRKWKMFSNRFMELFDFDYYPVSFEELMSDSDTQVNGIFNFIGEPIPSREIIDNWLDKSLVNRPKYT